MERTSLHTAFRKRWISLGPKMKEDILEIYQSKNYLLPILLPNSPSDNFDYVMARCWRRSDNIYVATERLRDERAIAYLATSKGSGNGFSYLSPRLRAEKAIACRAIALNGLNIGHTGNILKDDYDLARMACLKTYLAVREISDRLKQDVGFIEELMKHADQPCLLYDELSEDMKKHEIIFNIFHRRNRFPLF